MFFWMKKYFCGINCVSIKNDVGSMDFLFFEVKIVRDKLFVIDNLINGVVRF